MSPPSRGRWNGGALVPSVSICVFSTDELLLPGFAAAVGEEDFNRFDAALCDVSLARFLFDVFAAVRLLFAVLVLALALALVLGVASALVLGLALPVLEPADVLARAGRLDEVLGDFLRDFLDIRLPFVAFGVSIIGVLRVLAGEPDSSRRLGKSDGLGVWLQGIRRTACLLVE